MSLLLPLGPPLTLTWEANCAIMLVPTNSANQPPHLVPKGWGSGEGAGAGTVEASL